MKFRNVFLKFGSHKDYVDYRNKMLDDAEGLLNESKMEDYKAKMEDIKLFDNEYDEFIQEQANLNAMRNNGSVPEKLQNLSGENAIGGKLDMSFSDDHEYRMEFMNYVMYGEAISPKFKNQSQVTSTTDVGAVIPNTILNRIVEKMETVGTILNKVTRTFYKGGVTVPTSAAKPVATWTTEHGTSDKQKKALGSITFNYFKLRCVVAVGIATDTMTLEIFEKTLAKNVADAMVKALEEAIISGDGTTEPKGILKESNDETKVEIDVKKAITYADLCKAEGNLPDEYEKGAEWYMQKKTFFNQIQAMTDANGQPIARVNIGLDGKPEYMILGRKVNFCQYVPAYADTVSSATVFAFMFNMEDYILNTNLGVTIKKYEDHDTDDQITKAIMLADGKVIDKESFVPVVKKSAV